MMSGEGVVVLTAGGDSTSQSGCNLIRTVDDKIELIGERDRLVQQQDLSEAFMLAEDAQDVIDNANASIYGRQLRCGAMCADHKLFPQQPSILNLRWYIYLYYLPDSAVLLAPVDAAAISIASAYENADTSGELTPAGRTYISQDVASLQQYESLSQTERDSGTLAADALTYLLGASKHADRCTGVNP